MYTCRRVCVKSKTSSIVDDSKTLWINKTRERDSKRAIECAKAVQLLPFAPFYFKISVAIATINLILVYCPCEIVQPNSTKSQNNPKMYLLAQFTGAHVPHGGNFIHVLYVVLFFLFFFLLQLCLQWIVCASVFQHLATDFLFWLLFLVLLLFLFFRSV